MALKPLHTMGISMKSKLINEMNGREAMGVEGLYRSQLEPAKKWRQESTSLNVATLTKIIESKDCVLAERLLAGRLLALLGDPRVVTLNPVMITIEAAQTHIGLDPNSVADVIKQNSGLGLIPSWILKESPRHIVGLGEYKIGKYLVTNQEYAEFLAETHWSDIPTSWEFGIMPQEKSNHPVYTIKAESADAYCKWLSQKTGRRFRLPSEYEWEFAAAGPESFEYPWGNNWRGGVCNTVELGQFSTTPVGLFAEGQSYFGVMDMAGNVEEYTADKYRSYPGGKVIEDDLYLTNPQYRVARGGSFTRYKDLARCKRRHGRYPKDIYVMGFRLAEDV